MKKKTSAGVRDELKRQKRRQVELLTHLSARLAGVAMLVTVKIPGISTLTDAGAFLSLGETMMANQTLEGILGTLGRIAKAATPAPGAGAGDIPAPETETRQ
ncbi:hypothetical protein G3N56_19500 [Desulfovibrio sulfodismutans]|uniref:Uncharacterized protein n=1 Tax=Desulfolutivibrio sulfodismutans TaxID=63561 RepID=A0A7K3NS41_9BACT|nr:hypothetical protein [Desulfolutivibrio sulfodismutans]NDY58927.1 hypothetical protein [Desulfolutivibrio sulfodismutans]QLA13560.1 hypothetical protein GD606_15445 [Desulfolutivibrio sulfodismutans DSM 3696]